MTKFAKPSADQLRILCFLLSEEFRGAVELRKQVAFCETRSIAGTETFEIRVDARAPRAVVDVYIPVEAHFRSAARSQSLGLSGGPGPLAALRLHVNEDGLLFEVEEELAVPRELLGAVPDITAFELHVREWRLLDDQ